MCSTGVLRKCCRTAVVGLIVAALSQVEANVAVAQPAGPEARPNGRTTSVAPAWPAAQTFVPHGPNQPESPQPADVVLLVDGSLSTSSERADVFDLELAAAAAMALSEPDAGSRVAVSVFGSRDAPRQEPTAEVCLADHVGDRAERAAIQDCLARQAPRAEGEGADLPAALRQALAILGASDDGRDEIVFVLSDGVLRVDHSPSYPGRGENDETRNRLAGMSLGRLLAEDFGPRGIQVRPISFGKDDEIVPAVGVTGAQMLATLAAGGGQGRCPADAGVPRVAVGASLFDAVGVGLTALSSARCLAPPTPVHPTGLPDGTVELDAPVPLWAETTALTVVGTDGAGGIGDERSIGISYPDGRPVRENGDETVIDRLSNRRLIALRAQRPVPGIWRVRAPTTTDAPMGAFVTWTSQPAAAMLVDPARPDVHGADPTRARGMVDLRVRIFSRENAFRQDNLLGLAVDVRVTGDGMSDMWAPPLTGAVLDPKVGDVAEFGGTVVLPSEATGAVRFEALIHAGLGTPTVSRIVRTFVLDPNWDRLPPIEVASPNGDVVVSRGGAAVFELAGIHGKKGSTTVGIRLRDMTVGGFGLRSEQIQLPNSRGPHPVVSLVVPENAPKGRVHGVAEVFDPAHPEVVLSMTAIDFEVVDGSEAGNHMGRIVAFIFLGMLSAATVAMILIAMRRRRRDRERKERERTARERTAAAAALEAERERAAAALAAAVRPVDGLCVWLKRGEVFEDYLQARREDDTALYFDIVDADTRAPRLRGAGPDAYTGVVRGTTDAKRFEITWSNGMETEILRLDGKAKTTYGNLILEVTGRLPEPVHAVAGGGDGP